MNSVVLLHVLFFSLPWSRFDHTMDVGRTFSVYLCPLSFWLTLPPGVLSIYWCCPSRPLAWSSSPACTCMALFLALSLSPGNSLVSSWCDHLYASFLDLTVFNSSPALLRTNSLVFFAVHETSRISALSFQRRQGVFLHFFLSVHYSQPYVATGHHTIAFITRTRMRSTWTIGSQLT